MANSLESGVEVGLSSSKVQILENFIEKSKQRTQQLQYNYENSIIFMSWF